MKEILLRVNQNLLFFVLIVIVLYFGKPILVPLMLGALLAMLMAPVCQRLDDHGFSRSISTTICIIILLIALLAILAIIVVQINSFMENIHIIEKKARVLLWHVETFIEKNLNIDKQDQESIAKEGVQNGNGNAGMAAMIISGFTSTLATMALMLVYTFLFIYNKEKFETFFVRLYHEEDTDKVRNIVQKISLVGQRYLTGRAISVTILAGLYSIALLIIGVKSPLLLAGIAALLTIIPYVGSTLGGMFPFLMALTTEPSVQPAIWVAASIILIQTIDNYFIEPNVVGGEVNLSAFASILSIILGGVVWGIAGMILFLPIIGILKIIFDHVESLKPLGYVIGDERGSEGSKITAWLKEKLRWNKKEEENTSSAPSNEPGIEEKNPVSPK